MTAGKAHVAEDMVDFDRLMQEAKTTIVDVCFTMPEIYDVDTDTLQNVEEDYIITYRSGLNGFVLATVDFNVDHDDLPANGEIPNPPFIPYQEEDELIDIRALLINRPEFVNYELFINAMDRIVALIDGYDKEALLAAEADLCRSIQGATFTDVRISDHHGNRVHATFRLTATYISRASPDEIDDCYIEKNIEKENHYEREIERVMARQFRT